MFSKPPLWYGHGDSAGKPEIKRQTLYVRRKCKKLINHEALAERSRHPLVLLFKLYNYDAFTKPGDIYSVSLKTHTYANTHTQRRVYRESCFAAEKQSSRNLEPNPWLRQS